MSLAPAPAAARLDSPDPSLTANIYCEGLLDQVIQQVVSPFWSQIRQRETSRRVYLWIVRYSRGGEHLKLRLHAPMDQASTMRELLNGIAKPYLDSLGSSGESREGKERLDVPPIDAEDWTERAYPDRSLLWTEYLRSHVSLPAKPYLLDDDLVSRFTLCLGEACERALSALCATTGPIATKTRQTALLKGLISGLAATGFQLQECASYLAYHRDWLVRFTLQRNGADPEKGREVLDYFEEQVGRMRAAVDSLRKVIRSEWTGEPKTGTSDPWQRSLIDLMAWIAPRRHDPDYRIDPFAADPSFAPLFKVFHGFANALGLGAMEEGYTYHLLLRAAGVEETQGGLIASQASHA